MVIVSVNSKYIHINFSFRIFPVPTCVFDTRVRTFNEFVVLDFLMCSRAIKYQNISNTSNECVLSTVSNSKRETYTTLLLSFVANSDTA